jgi:hypothetical protein
MEHKFALHISITTSEILERNVGIVTVRPGYRVDHRQISSGEPHRSCLEAALNDNNA